MDFKEKYSQYPYGKERTDEILALSYYEFVDKYNKYLYYAQKDPKEQEEIRKEMKYFRDLRKQYPYGIDENNRVLALSDEEFEKEFGDKYRKILKEYEIYKDEAYEVQNYSYTDVIEARNKYDFFKDLREKLKKNDEQQEEIEK